MKKVDPVELQKLSTAVLAALQRANRLPIRLDEEDYADLLSEGVLAALSAMGGFDPARGSLGRYMAVIISRAQLREAWKLASLGITGNHRGVQVFSGDAPSSKDGEQIDNDDWLMYDGEGREFGVCADVADEVEAFDFIWKTYYMHDSIT